MVFNPVAIASIVPAVIAGALGLLTVTNLFGMRSRVFSWFMLAILVWTVSETMILSGGSLPVMASWLKVQFLAIPTVPVAWLLVVLRYTGWGSYMTRRNIILLLIMPLITFILVLTNDYHHLFYSSMTVDTTGQFPLLALSHGPLYWVHTVYSYMLVALSIILLWQGFIHRHSIYRNQAVILLLIVIVVISTNAVYIFGFFPIDYVDPSPIAFSLAGAVMVVGIVRYRTLNLVPIAREHVFETMVDAVVVIDPSQRLIDFNQRAQSLFHWAKTDIGKPVSELWSSNKNILELLESGTITTGTEISIHETDAVSYYQVSISSMSDKQSPISSRIFIFNDITIRKNTEINLLSTYEKEKELRLSLEEETKKRTDFTRVLFHELKTPLTSILAAGDMLSTGLKEEPWATLAGDLYRGAENLNHRLDDLLDLAKGEIGNLRVFPEPLALSQLLHQLVSEMTPAAKKREQTLKLEETSELPIAMADESRLRQVVGNLVNNAFKFSAKGDIIIVRARRDGNFCIIEVIDNGQGLTPDEQARVFHPYERLNAEKKGISGLGLGLALCRYLVELQGGRIWVQSEPGKGSTFGFSVPVYQAARPGNPRTSSQPNASL